MIKDTCCDWPAKRGDGIRILATARWPRGRTKDIRDVFMPDLAPNWETVEELRLGDLSWAKFVTLYRKKLKQPSRRHQLQLLAVFSETHGKNVTVMCTCEERERCHRSILVEQIEASYRELQS